MAELAIYQRVKIEGTGWRYRRVEERRGAKTGKLTGSFYIRHTDTRRTYGEKGKAAQPWVKLDSDSFEQAKRERDQKVKGITIAALDDQNRKSIETEIEKFLDQKRRKKSPATFANYSYILNEFLAQLATGVKFIDQVNGDVLDRHMRWLENQGAAPKTINNKMLVLFLMLKCAGVQNSSKLVELPTVEDEIAEPYTKEELKKLFAEMDEEEKVRYTFFLDTACREKEVAHAQWDDIKDGKYHIRSKNYTTSAGKQLKFSPKNHEARMVPLTRELVDMLADRRKTSKSKWIFPNEIGDPEGHFLRKFKKIAYRAGLNCGECHPEITTGRFQKETKKVCCKDYPEGCENHYLHRLRKTRATFWHTQGISLRTIQIYLAHKSLETTQKYLGAQSASEIQDKINAPMY
jgi:integrase